ncbi:MAG: glycoside hydrolase family 3 C-terminal domain-containing protein [Clostridiales bacterium]|nr:glycoside hydrolase family 3 C-terminal domain-containing protein [Clostridiales bacterium]
MRFVDKIDELTLDEKVLLLQAKNNWSLNGVERLGIPSIVLTDGPSGVRLTAEDERGTIPATAGPTEAILSSSWDTELVRKIGKMYAEECHYLNVGILLGPGINVKRSPLAGRNFEYYSEDPFLSGTLASAMIQSVQEEGIGTSLKHFVANDQETRRFTSNATVDERTLRELLLKPFEIAIREAKPWTIMGAYPKLRGKHCCENAYLLKTILRDQFGFDGVILSDWAATRHKVASHQNGLDLETGSFDSFDELKTAVENGEISMDVIDEHVRHVLELIQKVVDGKKEVEIDWDAHHKIAQEAARESIVLLKNEDDILPLRTTDHVAVIGKFARSPHFSGGGSSAINPKNLDVPFAWIQSYAKADFALGYDSEEEKEELVKEACEIAKNKDAVIVFIGTTEITESEGSDRTRLKLSESQIKLVEKLYSVNQNVILINQSGSAVELSHLETMAKGIFHMGLAGEGGGRAIADLLFGKAIPSGKLTETFPVCIENTPAYPFFPGVGNEIVYQEELLQGYRYYDTKRIAPQYEFGFGLSYTQFSYSNLRVSAEKITDDQTLSVSVDITNIGTVAGKEIIQLYVKDLESFYYRPEKELKGYQKVMLAPGEIRTVVFRLDQEAFAYYLPNLDQFAVETGEFEILVGASSRDIRLSQKVFVKSSIDVRPLLEESNTIGEFYNDDRYHDITKGILDQLTIVENSELFPIAAGITLSDFHRFLRYFQVPDEQGIAMEKMILGLA